MYKKFFYFSKTQGPSINLVFGPDVVTNFLLLVGEPFLLAHPASLNKKYDVLFFKILFWVSQGKKTTLIPKQESGRKGCTEVHPHQLPPCHHPPQGLEDTASRGSSTALMVPGTMLQKMLQTSLQTKNPKKYQKDAKMKSLGSFSQNAKLPAASSSDPPWGSKQTSQYQQTSTGL